MGLLRSCLDSRMRSQGSFFTDLAGGSLLPIYMDPLLSYKRENAKRSLSAVFNAVFIHHYIVPSIEIMQENVNFKHICTLSVKDWGTLKFNETYTQLKWEFL